LADSQFIVRVSLEAAVGKPHIVVELGSQVDVTVVMQRAEMDNGY
jgi:hypothetical protein